MVLEEEEEEPTISQGKEGMCVSVLCNWDFETNLLLWQRLMGRELFSCVMPSSTFLSVGSSGKTQVGPGYNFSVLLWSRNRREAQTTTEKEFEREDPKDIFFAKPGTWLWLRILGPVV